MRFIQATQTDFLFQLSHAIFIEKHKMIFLPIPTISWLATIVDLEENFFPVLSPSI